MRSVLLVMVALALALALPAAAQEAGAPKKRECRQQVEKHSLAISKLDQDSTGFTVSTVKATFSHFTSDGEAYDVEIADSVGGHMPATVEVFSSSEHDGRCPLSKFAYRR